MTNKTNKDYFLHETCLVGKPSNSLKFEIKQKDIQTIVEECPVRNLNVQNSNSSPLRVVKPLKLPNQKAALEAIREQLPSAQDQINKEEVKQ